MTLVQTAVMLWGGACAFVGSGFGAVKGLAWWKDRRAKARAEADAAHKSALEAARAEGEATERRRAAEAAHRERVERDLGYVVRRVDEAHERIGGVASDLAETREDVAALLGPERRLRVIGGGE